MLDDQNVSRIQINYVPENEVKHEKAGARCISSIWWAFTRLITLYVPDGYFEWRGVSDKDACQAWREKVAIFVVMILFSAVFVGVGGLLPLIACDDTEIFEKLEGGGFSASINKENLKCTSLKIMMYSITTVISVVLVIQCVCSLQYIARKKPDISNEKSNVLVMVPCYNEGEKELSKTFESVLRTRHPSRNKVLVVVADGIIQGHKEPKTTPEFIADELGYSKQLNNEKYIGTYDCTSVGEHATNKAHLYCGSYTKFENELKYIVVVKCGLEEEANADKPGNRGKRDSQLLIIGMLNRFHHERPLTNLDEAIIKALKNQLSMPLDTVKYLMAIDADTKIDSDSISHMIYRMNEDDTILALCGETRIENKRDSWVTWIQVFEYYTNHHMKKAFESVFGCVTCLPGCFTMYRLFTKDHTRLLSCDQVYQRYATNEVKSLHEKNLFHLGEDRMLTTLLLEAFPGRKLSFVPEAICYTIVPKSFMVLLSQRRRWINSTFHNLLELLRVRNMPTVCCVSMKALIALDLVATLILPASLIYIAVNICFAVFHGEVASKSTLTALGISIGVQVLPFLLRSDFSQCGWFIIYMVIGVPVFYFILPLYSFWQMDDFSWGATRQVERPAPGETDESNTSTVVDVENNSTRSGSRTDLDSPQPSGPSTPNFSTKGEDIMDELLSELDAPDYLLKNREEYAV